MLLEKLTKQTYLLTHDKGTRLSQGKEGSRSYLCIKHFADSGSKYFNQFRPNEGKQRDVPLLFACIGASIVSAGSCWLPTAASLYSVPLAVAEGGTVGWWDPACGQD